MQWVYICINDLCAQSLHIIYVGHFGCRSVVVHPASSDMDDSAGFCHRCSGRTLSGGTDSVTVAGNVMNKEVVMLYDLERARQLLVGATLANLPEFSLPVETRDQSGKSCTI